MKLNPETANMHFDNMKRKIKIDEEEDILDQLLMSGPKVNNNNNISGKVKKVTLQNGQKTLNFLGTSKQMKIVNDESDDDEDELYKF